MGFNGCEKNVDNMTNEICICQIDIDAEGTVYIAPKGHNEGFSGLSCLRGLKLKVKS